MLSGGTGSTPMADTLKVCPDGFSSMALRALDPMSRPTRLFERRNSTVMAAPGPLSANRVPERCQPAESTKTRGRISGFDAGCRGPGVEPSTNLPSSDGFRAEAFCGGAFTALIGLSSGMSRACSFTFARTRRMLLVCRSSQWRLRETVIRCLRTSRRKDEARSWRMVDANGQMLGHRDQRGQTPQGKNKAATRRFSTPAIASSS